MREVSRFGIEEIVILSGHLAEKVRSTVEEIAATLPKPVVVRFSEEPIRAGTGGALWHARDLLDERFLLLNGDSYLDVNIAAMCAAFAQDSADVIGRIVVRRVEDASRYGIVRLAADRVEAFEPRPAPDTAAAPGFINGGIYLFDRAIIDRLQPVCSLEIDILPELAREGRLRALPATGYFIDIGVPADFERAQTELPAALQRPALFLDRDGTINVDHGWVGHRERFEFIPGALETIAAATARGMHVFVVTNQSGIARGLYTEADFASLQKLLEEQALRMGGTIDDVRYCPFHPEAPLPAYRQTSDWRKPGPGMITDLLRAWGLSAEACLLLGDQPSDVAAAEAAGVQGALFSGGNLLDFARKAGAERGLNF